MPQGRSVVVPVPKPKTVRRTGWADLLRLDKWLAGGKWDVIHFNFGLHDLKHFKDGKLDPTGLQVAPVAEYERNLQAMVERREAPDVWPATR